MAMYLSVDIQDSIHTVSLQHVCSNLSNKLRFWNIITYKIISLRDPCHNVCRVSPPGDLEVSSN